MNKNGEIILIDDDLDDQELLAEAYSELGIKNKLTILRDGLEAYEYFNNTQKDLFLIISDINMPILTGIELRNKMQEMGEVRLRTIPFLFLTTGVAKDNVLYAYIHSVQGFFTKPKTYDELKELLRGIFEYWSSCTEPSFSNLPPGSKLP